MRRLAVGLIRLYQRTFSRALPATCRFRPTCSEYAAQAIQVHGLLRGTWLSIRRICRCHPFSKGGYDPVPGIDEDEIEEPAFSSDDRDWRH
ncbi:MAG: membrane protein insertion efficiency factor YidD [Armatimonadota bacterium]|nr:membrane protein insertion efficiency factor YidD [Armatimonadota bacterium]